MTTWIIPHAELNASHRTLLQCKGHRLKIDCSHRQRGPTGAVGPQHSLRTASEQHSQTCYFLCFHTSVYQSVTRLRGSFTPSTPEGEGTQSFVNNRRNVVQQNACWDVATGPLMKQPKIPFTCSCWIMSSTAAHLHYFLGLVVLPGLTIHFNLSLSLPPFSIRSFTSFV